MSKTVAKSLMNLTSSEMMKRILDPVDQGEDIVAFLKTHWAYDLYSRRPAPALLENGILSPTDLDLACFLSALADRKAVINLPVYKSRRPTQVRSNETIVSKDNRHGQVSGLTSNKAVWSFSVRINDMNVIRSDGNGNDAVGAPRTFMVTDLDGSWYDGWDCIEFVPSRKENDFLNDKKLWTGNSVYFKNFVHPNRWASFYGQWYLLTKVLIERLRAEASFYYQEVKKMSQSGIKFPGKENAEPETDFTTTKVGDSRSQEFEAFEVEIDGVQVPTIFPIYASTPDGMKAAKGRLNLLRYNHVPHLSFSTRATEFAFRENLKKSASGGPSFPAWIEGSGWEPEYKVKRTVWSRLVISQKIPFTKGLAIRFRTWEKLEQVSA